jgi:O-antigen biosynthesis alpha-1,3-rhamnosyltransferase
MKILVNATPLTNLFTGISRYVSCLYQRLEKNNRDIAVSYITNGMYSQEMPRQTEPAAWVKRTNWIWNLPDFMVTAVRSLYWLQYERRVRKYSSQFNHDLYHETGFVPVAADNMPVIYTLYDLSLLKYSEEHPRERVWFFNLFFKRRLPYAAHIITISEFMRAEMLHELPVTPEQVTAIPLAPDVSFFPRLHEDVAKMLDFNNLPKDYILFVGTLEPRKNLSILIKALALVKSEIPLVLVGWHGWGDKEWFQDVQRLGLEGRVYRTGYIDEETLAGLYSGARIFIYPSFYEGFGLPVLEAMSCGCPVICSRAASLPEVAGDAAIFFNPHSPRELAQAIEGLLGSEQMRLGFAEKGLKRAHTFSWDTTAAKTLDVFKQVYQEGRTNRHKQATAAGEKI